MQPSTFDDLGIDAMAGAEIMALLGLQPYQLNDPILFNRVQEVVGYMKDIPDKAFFINRITTGKAVDKLSHVWSYIELQKRKDALSSQISILDKDLNSFSEKQNLGQITDIERSVASESVRAKATLQADLNHLSEEEAMYSR